MLPENPKKDLSAPTGLPESALASLNKIETTRVTHKELPSVLPDPTQARVVLPPELHQRFYFPVQTGEPLDCFQAAAALLEAAQQDRAVNLQVQELLDLGASIAKYGQIGPATGYREFKRTGQETIRLIVGERRFWAIALHAVLHNQQEDAAIDVVIKPKPASHVEQIAENEKRRPLTTVGRAKAIAILALEAMGEPIDADTPDVLGRLRKTLAIPKMPDGVWGFVQEQYPYSRQHLKRILNILQLPDDLLYTAAVSRVPESVLRPILLADPSRWAELVRAAAQESLTAAEVETAISLDARAEKVEARPGKPSVHQRAASQVLSLVKLTRSKDFAGNYQEVAGLISQGIENPDDMRNIGMQLVLLGQALVQKSGGPSR